MAKIVTRDSRGRPVHPDKVLPHWATHQNVRSRDTRPLMVKKLLVQPYKHFLSWGAAVAQWIRLCLPFCRPGSNPKHTIYACINLNCDTMKRRK